MPNWMQFGAPKGATVATTMQLESEPAGAEARTSLGEVCRTPCSLAVAASEFTVSFSLPGYQTQTVPVRLVASTDPVDFDSGQSGGPRLVPNPVLVELLPAAPPPAAARRRPAPPQAAKPKPKPAAPTAMAPAPAPAPASPWPPPR